MRKRILVITITLLALLAGTAVAQENLLKNGEFSALNSKGLAADWTYGTHRGEVEMSMDEADAKEGKYALRIDGLTGDSHAQIQQLVETVRPDEVYRFSMWYKTKRMELSTLKDPFTVPIVVRLRFKDSTGAYITATDTLIKSVKTPQQVVYYSNLHLGVSELRNNEWTQFQFDVQAPAGTVSVWVEVFMWHTSGSLWLDDLQFTKVN